MIWSATGPASGETNCGNSASAKSATLGFSTLVRRPWRNTAARDSGRHRRSAPMGWSPWSGRPRPPGPGDRPHPRSARRHRPAARRGTVPTGRAPRRRRGSKCPTWAPNSDAKPARRPWVTLRDRISSMSGPGVQARASAAAAKRAMIGEMGHRGSIRARRASDWEHLTRQARREEAHRTAALSREPRCASLVGVREA